MGFMGQKKFGDDRKYFWFQVRFRGLITLGVWKSAKNIQKYFLPVGWLRDCRAVTAHFVHSNAPCNDRLCR